MIQGKNLIPPKSFEISKFSKPHLSPSPLVWRVDTLTSGKMEMPSKVHFPKKPDGCSFRMGNKLTNNFSHQNDMREEDFHIKIGQLSAIWNRDGSGRHLHLHFQVAFTVFQKLTKPLPVLCSHGFICGERVIVGFSFVLKVIFMPWNEWY